MVKNYVERFKKRVKALHGDPHYVALGMGIGVFIAITPTVPFHTILAIAAAFIFKASKPAAYLGIWISNPFTIVFLYVACYQAGFLFFEDSADGLASIQLLIGHLESDIAFSRKMDYFYSFLQTQMRTFLIMNLGGLLLGIPSGIAAYFITRRFFVKRQMRKLKKQIAGKDI